MVTTRMENHSHTDMGSNLRLLDSINKVDRLIDRAVEIGLKGICITDHESLSAAMDANLYIEKIHEKQPEFKLGLGNEIYLTPNRESGQKYYHFILIAKDKIGFRMLKEMSSRAHMLSYFDRGMERVPTTYEELENMVQKHPGHLIATTACLGGELSTLALQLTGCEKVMDMAGAEAAHNRIVEFVLWCKKLFGDDFFIECAPACSKDQIVANKRLRSIAAAFDVPMIIGSDAHYLKKSDRYVHEAYLNSKDGEREVAQFYEYAYLQTQEEIYENLSQSFEEEFIDEMCMNSLKLLYNKIENYSLRHKQTIPKVEVPNYQRKVDECLYPKEYPVINSMLQSEDIYDRYWVNECLNKLQEKGIHTKQYLDRLEEEADIKRTIGEKLETNMFRYPITLQHYVDMFWECGSIVGAGRGSSCSGLNHYLLGITQLDPIRWDLPFWRYLNKERTELGDIDLDLCPSKRPIILRRIKDERGKNFLPSIDELSRRNLGCTLIATFGTEGTRSSILTACRGYRSNEYPDGIDVDTAQYLSSLIPSERGFLWTLSDVVNGNEEKDRKPVHTFINEVNQYPGLLDIMMGIEGIVNKRSSHASGVILFDEDPYEFGCFMKTPSGEIITQWDLHMCEAAGMTKYDFLVTEVQDKLAECIRLLQEDGVIDKDKTLREVYDEYLHPEVLPLEDEKVWKAIQNNEILNIFQFDSDVGSQAAKKIKPKTIIELADANGLMRLMTSEKGEETPMEKYIRYKEDISLWYQEMEREQLTTEEMKTLEPYFLSSYGVPPSQEQLMKMLMDKKICNFGLAEANDARKIVGKKQMSRIPELRDKVISCAANGALGRYVWKYGIGPQMGYSFSVIHALAYSFIGFQTAYIATKWNPIYWDCACLIVNSGSLEDNSTEEIVDIYEPEHQEMLEGTTYEDLPDRSGKVKRTAATDYAKVAKAIGDITSRGIKVSLVDINKSDYGFKPDVENNQILYGLKALSNVGEPVIEAIKSGRPYKSITDFMNRCPLNKTAMISLIKSGAFDNVDKSWANNLPYDIRLATMTYYISKACKPKKRLTMQNFGGLLRKELIPDELIFECQTFNFNDYLKKNQKYKEYYIFNDICYAFFKKHEDVFNEDKLEVNQNHIMIKQTEWKKMYDKVMLKAKAWLTENQEQALELFNISLFNEMWHKYAEGSISAWEMESVCFYYHEHELTHIDTDKYGIVNFSEIESEEVDYFFSRNGRQIPIYKTYRIAGTVLSKNDNRSSIALLTTEGVVNVKFTREYYARIAKQISEKQADGTKKVVEKGWLKRGSKLLITGFKRDDMFVGKTYKNTVGHQVYLIKEVYEDGSLELTHNRWGEEDN